MSFFLITKDRNFKITTIKISAPGADFLSVLPTACMHLRFLTRFQKRQLKMPSSMATCNTCSTRAKKDSNQALSFVLILKTKQLIRSKPTGGDQVIAWGQSENRASKHQRGKKEQERGEKSGSSPKPFL